jgi:SAM-dependent methyltransferase
MLLPAGIRQAMRRWLTGSQEMQAAIPPSNSYEVVEGKVLPELMKGWQEPVVAARQHKAFLPLLQEMYKGKAREDFVAVAKAVAMTGLENPLIIEVGCGSGWNSEVLAYLLKKPVRYIGMDYAPAMTSLGKESYPNVQFVVGDATELPLRARG